MDRRVTHASTITFRTRLDVLRSPVRAGGASRLGVWDALRSFTNRAAPVGASYGDGYLPGGISSRLPAVSPRKKPVPTRRSKTLISARLWDQAALSKTFFILVCIGAVISVVSFCAIPVRCPACSASASICLRACSVDNSMNADGVFTPST